MNKRLFLLVLVVGVLLMACSNSDDDEVEAWMATSWLVDDPTPSSTTDVLKVDKDGAWSYFTNYAETVLADSGTFEIDGDTITYKGSTSGTAQYAKISENEWTWLEGGEITYYYRKSAYPAP